MPQLKIYDEYNQIWEIEEDDDIYEEAKAAIDTAQGQPVYWTLEKLTNGRGWGWWSVWKNINDVIAQLEKVMPNPSKQMLFDKTHDYSPSELAVLLLEFSGYVSFLNSYVGQMSAQSHSLKKSYEGAILFQTANIKESSEKAKEAKVLEHSELLRQTKRMQTDHESIVMLLEGWLDAYKAAYDGASRVLTAIGIEAEQASQRHN